MGRLAKPTFTDRSVQFANRVQLIKVDGTDDQFEVVPIPGFVTAEGTEIDSDLFNQVLNYTDNYIQGDGSTIDVDSGIVSIKGVPLSKLPVASKTSLGLVKVGDNIVVSSGEISVPNGDGATKGVVQIDGETIVLQNGKLVAPRGSDDYVLPYATPTTLGGVKVGETLTIDDNGVLNADVDPTTVTQLGTEAVIDNAAAYKPIDFTVYGQAVQDNAPLVDGGFTMEYLENTVPLGNGKVPGYVTGDGVSIIVENGIIRSVSQGAAYTPNKVLVSDGDGAISPSSVDSGKLSFISTLTSNAQAQLNNKSPITHTHTGIKYVANLTSDAQAQLNGKSPTNHTHPGLSYISDLNENVKSALTSIRGNVTSVEQDVSALETGKADTDHVHSASDITSGTLPISRGGTGASSVASALANLGLTGTATGNVKEHYKFGKLHFLRIQGTVSSLTNGSTTVGPFAIGFTMPSKPSGANGFAPGTILARYTNKAGVNVNLIEYTSTTSISLQIYAQQAISSSVTYNVWVALMEA